MDVTQLKNEAVKRLKGEVEAENPSKKKKAAVGPNLTTSGGLGCHRRLGPLLTCMCEYQQNEGPKMLEEYCKDLCAEVKAGKIDPVSRLDDGCVNRGHSHTLRNTAARHHPLHGPAHRSGSHPCLVPMQVIGRSREVARVTQILARRSKNNPILLGEPGVGKTAIAEGLAHAIVSRSNPDGTPLPSFLHEKRVMQLDISLIIAGAYDRVVPFHGRLSDRSLFPDQSTGAKERGELESRMTKLIAETKEAGDVILM